jgi:hypothetical protein
MGRASKPQYAENTKLIELVRKVKESDDDGYRGTDNVLHWTSRHYPKRCHAFMAQMLLNYRVPLEAMIRPIREHAELLMGFKDKFRAERASQVTDIYHDCNRIMTGLLLNPDQLRNTWKNAWSMLHAAASAYEYRDMFQRIMTYAMKEKIIDCDGIVGSLGANMGWFLAYLCCPPHVGTTGYHGHPSPQWMDNLDDTFASCVAPFVDRFSTRYAFEPTMIRDTFTELVNYAFAEWDKDLA